MLTRRAKLSLNLESCCKCGFTLVLSLFMGWFIWIRTANGMTTALAVLMIMLFCTLAPSVKKIP